MLKRTIAAFVVAAGIGAVAAPALAAGPVTVCYGASVTVNGSQVVDQADCQP